MPYSRFSLDTLVDKSTFFRFIFDCFPRLKQDELAHVRRQSIGNPVPTPTVLNHKVIIFKVVTIFPSWMAFKLVFFQFLSFDMYLSVRWIWLWLFWGEPDKGNGSPVGRRSAKRKASGEDFNCRNRASGTLGEYPLKILARRHKRLVFFFRFYL